MSNNERNTLGTELHLANLAKLVLGLLISDTVNNKASLNIVKDTEVLTGLFNLNNIHETGREIGISANLSINLDETLHDDAVDLTLIQSILQTVTDEDNQGQAFTELVGTRRGAGSLNNCDNRCVISS